MAFQDLYEFKLHSTYLGQSLLNIFHFEYVEGGTPSNAIAAELRNAFRDTFLTAIADGPLISRFSDALTYTSVEITNLSDPSVLVDQAWGTPQVGIVSGDDMPPYVCAVIRTGRLAGDIRRGQKRFAGVTETFQSNGILIQLFLDSLQDICDGLNSPIELAAGAGTRSYQSVIVKRVQYTTPGGKTAYRLPETSEEAIWYPATTWQPVINLSTQNTRKYSS
jgi:hypothetical protein